MSGVENYSMKPILASLLLRHACFPLTALKRFMLGISAVIEELFLSGASGVALLLWQGLDSSCSSCPCSAPCSCPCGTSPLGGGFLVSIWRTKVKVVQSLAITLGTFSKPLPAADVLLRVSSTCISLSGQDNQQSRDGESLGCGKDPSKECGLLFLIIVEDLRTRCKMLEAEEHIHNQDNQCNCCACINIRSWLLYF